MTRTDDLLDHVVCPACGSDLASVTEQLRCARGHVYPVVSGVPRLLTWTEDAKATASTFTQQWAQFDYEQDRTWGGTAAERLAAFLDDVGKPPDWFAGKCVLDAGCGNGVLSHAISSLGCRVVATDLSESVVAAHRRFGEAVLFFQGDLGRSALRSRTFDLIYCGGVLHHTPSTRAALEQLVRALRPGGTIYLWLYTAVPGVKYTVKKALRRLPPPARRLVAVPFATQGALRDRSKTWREHLVTQFDFFTPRFRWEHTPAEVSGWLTGLGFSDVVLRAESRDGFGILAKSLD